MPTLKNRLAKVLLRDEYKKAEDARTTLVNMYRRRAMGEREERLGEVDGRTAWNLGRHHNDILMNAGQGEDNGISENERLEAVKESRRLYYWDVLTKGMIRLWTNFGFGRTIDIVARDEAAQIVWEEFWKARRNSPILGTQNIHTLSHRLLVDGEFWFVLFCDESTGISTVRIVDTTEISGIITLEDDKDMPVYYERTFAGKNNTTHKWYYRDWQASDEDVADVPIGDGIELAERNGVTIRAMHVRLPGLNDRGVPLLLAGFLWTMEYADFLQSRVALQKMVGMFAQDIQVEGGSRAVDAVKDFFQSSIATGSDTETNPAPPVGSPWIHNRSTTGTRNPLTTGAGDAQTDASMFMGMIGMAGNVYSHYLGMGDFYKLATATAMERPTQVQWELYQSLWADTWRSLAEIVLTGYEEVTGVKFDSQEVDVTQDAVVEQDLVALTGALNTLYIQPQATSADPIVPHDVAVRLALQVLNVMNPDEVMAQMEVEKEEADKEREENKKRMDAIMKAGQQRAAQEEEEDGPTEDEAPVTNAQEMAIIEAALRVVARGS